MKAHDLLSMNTLTSILMKPRRIIFDGYHQINHHWTKDFYGEENAKILDKVSEIAHTRLVLLMVRNITTTMIFRVTTLMLLTM